jgi:phage terminase small subunit
MTDKQTLFIEYYLTHFNATRAAIEAGYSPESAKVIASENLTKPDIKEVVDTRIKEIICQSDDKRAKLIHFWDSIINDEDESTSARLKAADSLGKYLAMFVERIEHTGDFKPVEFVIHSKVERE